MVRSKRRTLVRPWFFRSLLLFLVALLGACRDGTLDTDQAILGRWQRVSLAGPGDPSELSAEYLEFQEAGSLLTLLKDEGTEMFWLIHTATYTVTSTGQMEVTGSCWKGWERSACSRTYSISLTGDELRITADREAVYLRIGGQSRELPPTLAPPIPSPTPQGSLYGQRQRRMAKPEVGRVGDSISYQLPRVLS